MLYVYVVHIFYNHANLKCVECELWTVVKVCAVCGICYMQYVMYVHRSCALCGVYIDNMQYESWTKHVCIDHAQCELSR